MTSQTFHTNADFHLDLTILDAAYLHIVSTYLGMYMCLLR